MFYFFRFIRPALAAKGFPNSLPRISTVAQQNRLLGVPMAFPAYLAAVSGRICPFALHGDGLVQDSHLFP